MTGDCLGDFYGDYIIDNFVDMSLGEVQIEKNNNRRRKTHAQDFFHFGHSCPCAPR